MKFGEIFRAFIHNKEKRQIVGGALFAAGFLLAATKIVAELAGYFVVIGIILLGVTDETIQKLSKKSRSKDKRRNEYSDA